ncbi:MAG: nuclear transport factor 2 family protein [Pirellulales bacterium]
MNLLNRRTGVAVAGMLVSLLVPPAYSQDNETAEAIHQNAKTLVAALNAGKAAEVGGMFLPKGELIDEAGTVYQGPSEIEALLTKFYERFPGAKLTIEVESIRPVGPVAIEEGSRTFASADGDLQARFRYIAIWAKTDDGWKLASFRDFADDPVPTPHEFLEPLGWLVGEWINEGTDGKVAISYRWSDDKNYLLGEFQMESSEGKSRKSTQRIGWDPSAGRIRSWLFDADGGFAEGEWTAVDEGLVVKSSSVNPDGTTATATLNITPQDKDHFSIEASDRVVGGIVEDDFKIVVTRRPPTPGK